MELDSKSAGQTGQTPLCSDLDASRPQYNTLRLMPYRPCGLAALRCKDAARNLHWLCPVGDASRAFSAAIHAVCPSVEPNVRARPDSPNRGDRRSTEDARVAVRYHAGP